jgi:hypothetical protein
VGERSEPDAGRDLPFADSLCHRCAACRYVRGRATLFLQCTALPAKYLPQPVRSCVAYRPADGPVEGMEPET